MVKQLITGFVLMLSVCAFAQTELDEQIKKSLLIHYGDKSSSRISLFFNQPAYSAGDTAFFRAFYSEISTRRPLSGKYLLQLRLTNSSGVIVLRQFFYVNEGIGLNQIVLPGDLSAGMYRLICWNAGMNNFGRTLYYQRQFEIVGEKKIIESDRSFTVVPEGGALTEGVINRIFVRQKSGRKSLCIVRDQQKNEVIRFTTDEYGLGNFELKPEPGNNYSVSTPVHESSIPVTTMGESCSMKVIINDDGLEVTMATKVVFPEIFLIGVQNEKLFFSAKISSENSNSFTSKISANLLPSGFYQLVVFDKEGKWLGGRLLFNRIAAEDPIITHSDKVSTRSKVDVVIQAKEKGDLSIRVYQRELFSNKQETSMREYLDLLANTGDSSIQPSSFLLDSTNTINNFLATQQWKIFSWDSIGRGLHRASRIALDRSRIIKGRVYDRDSYAMIPEPAFLTFYFENSTFLQETYIDREGNFRMDLQEPIDINEKVYYKVDLGEKELRNAVVEVVEDSYAPASGKFEKVDEADSYYDYAKMKRSVDQSYSYAIKDLKKMAAERKPNRMLEDETMGVDVEYSMGDYKIFNSMEEIAVEILPRVIYKKEKGKVSVRMYLEEWGQTKHELSKGSPTYVIDGVMTNDSEFFLNLNPADLDKIKLLWSVERRRVLGALGINGVILIETKNPAIAGRIDTSHSINVTGISEPLPFHSVSNVSDIRKPILRSSLAWLPSVKTDGEDKCDFSFFTSDDLGEYVIEITGITSTGKAISEKSYFSVVPPLQKK